MLLDLFLFRRYLRRHERLQVLLKRQVAQVVHLSERAFPLLVDLVRRPFVAVLRAAFLARYIGFETPIQLWQRC